MAKINSGKVKGQINWKKISTIAGITVMLTSILTWCGFNPSTYFNNKSDEKAKQKKDTIYIKPTKDIPKEKPSPISKKDRKKYKKKKTPPSINIGDEAHDIVISNNQIGGQTAHTIINNNNIPEPKISLRESTVDQFINGKYVQDVYIDVIAQVTVPNLTLEVFCKSINDVNITTNDIAGIVSFTQSRKAGVIYNNIKNPSGSYKVSIFKTDTGQVNINYHF